MSDRGRGGRGRPEHRAYEDYDDSYATPRSRPGVRSQQQYGERSYRGGGKYDGPQPSQVPVYYAHDLRDYAGPMVPTYGYPQAWGQGRPARAPYATGYQPQYQEPYAICPPDSARSASGSRWSGAGGGRPPSARPPSSSGGGGVIAGGNGRPHGMGPVRQGAASNGSRPNSARPTSRGRTAAGSSSAGGSGASSRSRSNSRAGGGGGRVRAPYVTVGDPVSQAPAVGQHSGATSTDEATPAEPELPSNPHFLTPAFPQPPRTRTDSCNTWALMVEASGQTLEAVVGPFLEGTLMELFGESWERELSNLDLTLPPFSAATCADLVSRCKQLHERLPITIHKRVEAVGKATSALAANPSSLEPEDVMAAHNAMKGMLQDCIKAMKMPSLLGEGSRQFKAFTAELLPHAESTLLYYDMLLADCTEAAAMRQQVRSAAGGGEEGSRVALPALSDVASP